LAWSSTWTDRRDRDRTPSIPGHDRRAGTGAAYLLIVTEASSGINKAMQAVRAASRLARRTPSTRELQQHQHVYCFLDARERQLYRDRYSRGIGRARIRGSCSACPEYLSPKSKHATSRLQGSLCKPQIRAENFAEAWREGLARQLIAGGVVRKSKEPRIRAYHRLGAWMVIAVRCWCSVTPRQCLFVPGATR
jgi:hypothetical protein